MKYCTCAETERRVRAGEGRWGAGGLSLSWHFPRGHQELEEGPLEGLGGVPGGKEKGAEGPTGALSTHKHPSFPGLGCGSTGHSTHPKERWLTCGTLPGLLVGPGEPRCGGAWGHTALSAF